MKTKKERFHVGALNQDLEGEMSRQEEEEERGGGVWLFQNALLNFTSHSVGGRRQRQGEKKVAQMALKTHRFGIKLVSVLRQNLFHPGLVCVCYKAKPPAKKGRHTVRITQAHRGARSLRGKA